MLSRESRHWYAFFRANPEFRINYRSLMEEGGVSKRRSLSILKELTEADLLKVSKLAGGGTTIKVVTSDVPTVGTSGYAYTAVTLVSSISNSRTAVTTDKATNKFQNGVLEKETNMAWNGLFDSQSGGDDEILQERAKHLAQKKAEYDEKREAARVKKDVHRSGIDPINWTCKDVAFEFGDRVNAMWNIPPFSVLQTRFVQALGTFRKQHDTNGAIELELLNLFFSTLQDSKYTDGNHMWRAFMYQAPQLLQTARENVVTPDKLQADIERDAELTSRKLALFEED